MREKRLEEQVLTYPAGFPMCVHTTKGPPIYSILHPKMNISSFQKTSVISEKASPEDPNEDIERESQAKLLFGHENAGGENSFL
jgi:hypothetical protein